MCTFIQFILLFAIFFIVNYVGYWLTEVKGMPEWLMYKPFECRLCFTFWSLISVYTAILLSFGCLLYLGIGGIILAILNAIAMYINQKRKTIKL